MTEEEAKTKWCPFSRQIGGIVPDALSGQAADYLANAAVFNRAEGGHQNAVWPAGAACIGSGCMAWRAQADIATETTRSAQSPAGEGWLPGPGYDDWTRVRRVELGGFCGLAGAPQ